MHSETQHNTDRDLRDCKDATELAANPDSRFHFSARTVSEPEWHEIVMLFSDATIHQTWTFGAISRRAGNLSHLVLYEGDEIVAAAQLALVSMPLLKSGIAHCKFGPMWRRRGAAERVEIYSEILAAMRAEYADRQGLVLRVKPWTTDTENEQQDSARRAAGLKLQADLPQYHTYIVDMSRSVEELRAGFSSKWRYNLKKAEKQSIEIGYSSDQTSTDQFMELYAEMRQLKTFVDTSEIAHLPEIMSDLPEDMRPTIFVAHVEGKLAAAIVISTLGLTAYYLFGATGAAGRSSGASYVLFWHAMNWLKEKDCVWFDLVGSQPQGTGGNAGYRRFKSGLTGNNGAEYHMSDWEASGSWRSHLMVHSGFFLRHIFNRTRHKINGFRELLARKIGP